MESAYWMAPSYPNHQVSSHLFSILLALFCAHRMGGDQAPRCLSRKAVIFG